MTFPARREYEDERGLFVVQDPNLPGFAPVAGERGYSNQMAPADRARAAR